MMGFHTTLGTTADAGCTTSHGPMVRRLPLLYCRTEAVIHSAWDRPRRILSTVLSDSIQHGAVGGLAHTVLIHGKPRTRHLGSEQGISHPPCGGSVPDVPCLDGQVRNVPPVTDGSGLRQRLPCSGPGYCGPSERAILDRSDCIVGNGTMPPNSSASVGKPALPIPTVAQHRVDFLPAVNGGVSVSEER